MRNGQITLNAEKYKDVTTSQKNPIMSDGQISLNTERYRDVAVQQRTSNNE